MSNKGNHFFLLFFFSFLFTFNSFLFLLFFLFLLHSIHCYILIFHLILVPIQTNASFCSYISAIYLLTFIYLLFFLMTPLSLFRISWFFDSPHPVSLPNAVNLSFTKQTPNGNDVLFCFDVAKLLEISIIRLRRRPASWSFLVISSPGIDAKYIVGKHEYSDEMV